jgi:hypothetical protein
MKQAECEAGQSTIVACLTGAIYSDLHANQRSWRKPFRWSFSPETWMGLACPSCSSCG